MPRFEFEQPEDTDDWTDRVTRLMNVVVRGIGLILLLTGVYVALLVISSAWSLYDDPASIEGFARAIERGSNLDLTLSQSASSGRRQLDAPVAAADDAPIGVDPQNDADAQDGDATFEAQPAFRFSYFAAWLIAILLLMLVGRLAIAAVKTGGELALYDVQVKKLARALIEERARAGRPPA